jgi:hypothetical protein
MTKQQEEQFSKLTQSEKEAFETIDMDKRFSGIFGFSLKKKQSNANKRSS